MKSSRAYCTHFIICLAAISMVAACRQNDRKPASISRSFYYWKSVFNLSDYEKMRLDGLHINTLYLKFFDVGWNNSSMVPMPIAQLRIEDAGYLRSKKIIPVVFITNECIYKIDPAQIQSIAFKINTLVNNIISINQLLMVHEIQIDCDWTETTKTKYFALLQTLQADSSRSISATIRLHQIKFMAKTGVPPVKKGLLMCYNMGNLKNPATTNSILEPGEVEKYIGGLSRYPLQLDVGLPLFEWAVLFRNNNFIGLLQNLPPGFFKNKWLEKNGNRYIVPTDTTLAGYSFQRNDVLRYEQSSYTDIADVARLVAAHLPVTDTAFRVSLFHLDSLTLSKYPLYEIKNMYDAVH